MIYSEKQYKELEEKYRKLKQENEIKEKEVKLLKEQNKQKDEVIHDLDKNNYRGQCETLRIENKELKKKLKIYEEKFELARISLKKNSSNSINITIIFNNAITKPIYIFNRIKLSLIFKLYTTSDFKRQTTFSNKISRKPNRI